MSQESQVLEDKVKRLESRIIQIMSERDEYKSLYASIATSHWKAVEWAGELQELLGRYQAWFSYHRNWTDHHNRMIQWNPELGHPDIAGGDPETPDLDEMSSVV